MGALWIYGGAAVEGPNQDIVVTLPVINNMDIEGVEVIHPKINKGPEPPENPIEDEIWIDTNIT